MSLTEFEHMSNNTARLKSEYLSLIRDKLSIRNKKAKFLKKINPHIPERMYAITQAGKFEIGLFTDILQALKTVCPLPEISMDDELKYRIKPTIDSDIKKLSKLSLTPYPYQQECVQKMFKYGRGTILVGTGGGKTLIMSLFLSTLYEYFGRKKTLIVVPTIQLVEQTYEDLKQYGIDEKYLSKWSGTNKFSNTDIIIAGVDILNTQTDNLDFLKQLEILIIDEVHILKKDNLINDAVKLIPTPNRFGFTGTLPEEMQDQWNIFGKIGPIIFEKLSDSLRNDEYISDVKITVIDIEYTHETKIELANRIALAKQKLRERTAADISTSITADKIEYQEELNYVIDVPFRNDIISLLACKAKKNTLIMVDRIAHGELLLNKITKESDKKIFFIQGNVEVDIREKIREKMENETDIICIAISSIFSTGINIKNIHNIIFCTPGKAKVKLIQSIGRGLRLLDGKTILNVYDIADDFRYSEKHLQKRCKLYKTEKIPYEIKKIKQKL